MNRLCLTVKNVFLRPSKLIRSMVEEKRIEKCAWLVLVCMLVSGDLEALSALEYLISVFVTMAFFLVDAAFVHGMAWLLDVKGEFKALLVVKGYLFAADLLLLLIYCFWMFDFPFSGFDQEDQINLASSVGLALTAFLLLYGIWRIMIDIIVIRECYRASLIKALGIFILSCAATAFIQNLWDICQGLT